MPEVHTLAQTAGWKRLREQERENLWNLKDRLVEKHRVSKLFPPAKGIDVSRSAAKPFRVGTKEHSLESPKASDTAIPARANSEVPGHHSANMHYGQLEGLSSSSSSFVALKYPRPRELSFADVEKALSRLSTEGFLPD